MASMSRPNRHRLARLLAPALSLLLLASLAPAGLLAADVTDEILVRFRDGTPPEVRDADRPAVRADRPERPGRQYPRPQRRPPGSGADRSRRSATRRTGRSLATAAPAPGCRPERRGRRPPTDATSWPSTRAIRATRSSTTSCGGCTTAARRSAASRPRRAAPASTSTASQAFAHELGDPDLVVAVIDDGIDFSHPDLAERAWTNPGESGAGKETNGVDDDANGFIDDVHGWDFCKRRRQHGLRPGPGRPRHARRRDHRGLAQRHRHVGVAPGIQLMALKFIKNNGCGMDQMAIDAVDYARRDGRPHHQRLVGRSRLQRDARGRHRRVGCPVRGRRRQLQRGHRPRRASTSTRPRSRCPTSCPWRPSTSRAARAAFSNYGDVGVDIAAPGTNILSTWPSSLNCPSPCYAWSAGHVHGGAARDRRGRPHRQSLGLRARRSGPAQGPPARRPARRWRARPG